MTRARGLRIMFVTSMFPAPSEAFAAVEVRALLAQGADVRVASLRSAHPMARELCRDAGLDYAAVDSLTVAAVVRGFLFALRHPLRTLAATAWLVRLGWRKPLLLARTVAIVPRMLDVVRQCMSWNADVLHLFWGHSASYIGHLLGKFDRTVVISTSLGAYDLEYGRGPWIDLAGRADVVWTHAEVNRRKLELLGVPSHLIQVRRRGIDLSRLPAETDRIPGKLVCVARLVPEKGADLVLRAFASVHRGFADSTLTIIGEGPERGRFESLARELGVGSRVRFTGPVPHGVVLSELATADVFALLSHSPGERLPNVVKEAMACGCICVVTETPGIDELIAPLSERLVVPRGDWQQAALLIERVLANAQKFAVDRQLGREYMRREFDANAVAAARIAAWRAIIESRSARNAGRPEAGH
jgi:glycosyltransferase involved in cell wall biosynthesis